jgi:hypothetical protein
MEMRIKSWNSDARRPLAGAQLAHVAHLCSDSPQDKTREALGQRRFGYGTVFPLALRHDPRIAIRIERGSAKESR